MIPRIALSARLGGFAVLLALIAMWWAVGASRLVDPIFLPSPVVVAASFWRDLWSNGLLVDCAITFVRFSVGLYVATLIACPLGVVIGRSDKIYWLLEPTIEVLRPIPSAAVIPVAILFFGIGDGMKIAVIVFGSLWPILLNTVHGIRSVDGVLEETGRSLGLTRTQLLVRIILPAAAPSVATGARIGAAVALILAITVEMIAGNSGLGFRILDSERSFQYPRMYAGIVAVGIVGWGLNALLTAVDRRFLFWIRRPGAPQQT